MPLAHIRPIIRQAILEGKTVDIRQRKRGDEPRWEIGKDYLLTARMDTRFVVIAIRDEWLHEVDDEQARREGFRDRASLLDYWRKAYREGPGVGPPAMPWIKIPTWVITVALDTSERPAFMAADSSHGYTSDHLHALDADAEVVPKVWLDAFAQNGRTYGELRRLKAKEEARGELSLEDRLRRARAQAAVKGRDMSRHLRVIERRIQAIEDEAA